MEGRLRFCPNGHGEYSPEADLCNDCGARLVLDRSGESIDGWTLGHLIGIGGSYTSIWEAEREGTRAALRVVEADPEAPEARRLLRAASLLQDFEHANIVRTLASGQTEDGEAFAVSELLHGRTLREVLQQRGTVPLVQALYVVQELLQALAYVHARGIVHRDVRAGTVHLTPRGNEPWQVRLIDFSVAKQSGPVASRVDLSAAPGSLGRIIGTAEYMPPEQVLGARVDGRADLYATGVLLYRLVTGEMPFSGTDRNDLYLQQLRRPPAPPRAPEGQPPLSLSLEATMASALAKQPSDRFANAEAFRAALETA